jgi:hypothetical protein
VKHHSRHGRSRAFKTTVGAAALAAAFAAAPIDAIATDFADSVTRFEFAHHSRLWVFGLTDDQRLVKFAVARPQHLRKIGKVSGLQAPDSSLVGIDFRVQDGNLYGLGNGGGIYIIDTHSAYATLVTRLTVALSGTQFGVDFNPAANALRIVSDTGQNLRHPFAAGPLQFMTQTDDPLDYPPPPPALNTPGPTALGVSGAAYTNNDLDTNTATTLFDIDTMLNQVAIQSPPNNGSLVATGALGVDPDGPVGFDIYTNLRKGSAASNSGFASLVVNGVTGFYRVNLLTGQVGLIGYFDRKVVDIAIPLDK